MNVGANASTARKVAAWFLIDHVLAAGLLAGVAVVGTVVGASAPRIEGLWVAFAIFVGVGVIGWYRYEACRHRLVLGREGDCAVTPTGLVPLKVLRPRRAGGTVLGVQLVDAQGLNYYHPWRWQARTWLLEASTEAPSQGE